MLGSRIRWLHLSAGVCAFLTAPAVFSAGLGESEASRAGMQMNSAWSTGVKQAFGTSYEEYDSELRYSGTSRTAPISRAWFTAGRGILNEVYWPTLDTAQVKDSQILVTDGETFLFEEAKDAQTEVRWRRSGIPVFEITNRDPKGRFVIEKTLFTDPRRDSVIQRVKITRFVAGLKFYALHKPAVENTPLGDSARVQAGKVVSLQAWQSKQAQAVVFSIPLKQASAGFSGSPSDGWQDLNADFRMDSRFTSAKNGNVVLTAWLDIPETVGTTLFEQIISFGTTPDEADAVANETLSSKSDGLLEEYAEQWETYQNRVRDLSANSGDGGKIFRASIALLKSSEDKTFAGAFIASPSIPWGNHTVDSHGMPIDDRKYDNQTGGYHAVWPRDLFQMATSFMAVDDFDSAIAALNYLRKAQYRNSGQVWDYGSRHRSRDGSWGQSLWVNGDDRWRGLQMDQTAMPLMLAYRLWKAGKVDVRDYWEMVRDGADFIAEFGPWSAMERWEEAMGASPSNIAAMISALWTSAEIADRMGDSARAARYRNSADQWSAKPGDNLDTWLFTQTGRYGNGAYFQRIEGGSAVNQTWNPNDDLTFLLANGSGSRREKDVIDGGFLELVRYGVRGALDEKIRDTMPEYDSLLRADVPGRGPGYIRYLGDRYNYSDVDGKQTDGMLWPLLSGERGHYELALALAQGLSAGAARTRLDPYLRAMENFATDQDFIPEQVWRDGASMGESTGAATPLGWAHGEYLKLLRSRRDGQVFDEIPLVKLRQETLFYR